MAEKAQVEVVVTGKDQASKPLGTVGRGAENTAQSFNKLKLAVIGMGVALAVALGKMVNDFAKAGDEVAKMSKRTGIAVEALSEMRHVANICGTSLDSFETAIKKMQRAIIDANSGMKEYKEAFERLGLSMTDIMAMKPEDQFWTIAAAIGDIEDPTLAAATAQDIFGRSGTDLLPIFAEERTAIADLKQEAHDLNLVFSDESAKAAEEFTDAKTRLVGALNGIKYAIAEELMPVFTSAIDKMTGALTGLIDFIKGNEGLGTALKWLGTALLAFAISAAVAKFIAVLRTIIVSLATATGFATMGAGVWVVIGQIAAGMALLDQLLNLQLLSGTPLEGLMAKMPFKNIYTPESEAAGEFKAPSAPSGYASWDVYMSASGKYEAGGGGPSGSWLSQEEKQKAIKSEWQRQGIKGIPADYLPSLKYGGVVQGPIGQPVPIMAHGGERFLGPNGGGVNITVMGSLLTERDLGELMNEYTLKRQGRNYNTGFKT